MPKQLLTIDEATVLVAMAYEPPGPTTPTHVLFAEYWLCQETGFSRSRARVALIGLHNARMVKRVCERLVYPAGLNTRGVQTTMWRRTRSGVRRRAELLSLPQAVTDLIATQRGLRTKADRLLAESYHRPGPSRAMYPASVLQGRGG